jgi:KipI family sensor histidine kinase inhibitor
VNGVEVVRVAERALLVRFLDPALESAVAKAVFLFRKTRDERVSGRGRDEPAEAASESLAGARAVVGAGSLLVELGSGTRGEEVERARERLARLAAELDAAADGARGESVESARARQHTLGVRFGGAEGPDLDAVARECGLAAEEVVARLCAAELRVGFVGFAPGFGYLVGLPRELEVPRLPTPRARVPAGSVAIAGPFAGVYPSATPGGWRLLGRAEAVLFDPRREPPALLAPGDGVRFVPR